MKRYLDFADSEIFAEFADVEVLYDGENGFLLYGNADCIANCYAADETAAKIISELIPKTVALVSVHGDVLKSVLTSGNFVVKDDCFQFEYYGNVLKLPESKFFVRKLCVSDFYKIKAFYDDENYIKKLLEKGVFYGAFDGENLIGAIGEHERGTIGLLYVNPKYRRMGVAKLLSELKINEALRVQKTPVLHVVSGNIASYNLQKKVGYEVLPDKTYWLKPKEFYE